MFCNFFFQMWYFLFSYVYVKKNHDSNLVWITNNWSKSTSDVQTLDDNFIYLILAVKTLKNEKKSHFREIQEKKKLKRHTIKNIDCSHDWVIFWT